jgi:hypothetical protein|nr:MAG TPA: hypothetical protein [Bacteriophage sp.]
MKGYLIYKEKTTKELKKLLSSGDAIFGKYRPQAIAFIKYLHSDFDNHVAFIEETSGINVNQIKLEQVFPKRYKWFVSDVALRGLRTYLKEVEHRVGEFEGGKENNLRLLIGVHFLRFVLLTKIVLLYLDTYAEGVQTGFITDGSRYTLDNLGINRTILKYLDVFQEYDSKTIDDWLAMTVEDSKIKLFFSTMKRIMTILQIK